MPSVTVLDLRRADRHVVGDTDMLARAQELARRLSAVSGQRWEVGRYVPVDAPAPHDAQGRFDVTRALADAGATKDQNVWVFGDGRMPAAQEQYFAGLPGGRVQVAQVFNTERPEEMLHTVGHTVELLARWGDPKGLREYTGRPESDPWLANLGPPDRPVVVSPAGHGTIHVPPGATRQYDYSVPGPWGGTEDGFYNWWLNESPRQWWSYLGDAGDAAANDSGQAEGAGQLAAAATPPPDRVLSTPFVAPPVAPASASSVPAEPLPIPFTARGQ